MTLCRWHWTDEHDDEHCPAQIAIRANSPRSVFDIQPTDEQDRLADRMLAYRTALKAHLGYAAEHGFTFPEIIRTLDPDYLP